MKAEPPPQQLPRPGIPERQAPVAALPSPAVYRGMTWDELKPPPKTPKK